MRIVQVGTTDSHGGAAQVAATLQSEFLTAGHKCVTVVGSQTRHEPGIRSINGHGLLHGIEPALLRMAARLGREDLSAVSCRLLRRRAFYRECDIVQLHNLHGGYFNMRALPSILAGKAAVWTLHDCCAFTGHCAHPGQCDKWKSGCGHCQGLQLPPALKRDTTALQMKVKVRAYAGVDVRLVLPSRSLEAMIRESVLRDMRYSVIPNGVDMTVFRPLDRTTARRSLGLPEDVRLVLAYASEPMNPYKGFDHLLEVVRAFAGDTGTRFVVVGRADNTASIAAANPGVILPGSIHDRALLALYLCAADVFLSTSVNETHPLAAIEALACGTPVVGYSIGGHPEIVDEGVTGWLARRTSAGELVRLLRGALGVDRSRAAAMSTTAREVAERRFSSLLQAQRYIAVYEEELDRRIGA